MVTDIHDWTAPDTNQPHPIFSSKHNQEFSAIESTTHSNAQHCHVCSYDHGGHIGQTLTTFTVIVKSIPTPSIPHPTFSADDWYSRYTQPMLRPPIA